MKLLLSITLPLYLVDQVTKWLVLRFISTDEFVPVISGFFYLVQVHNTGAAFGMLKNNNLFFMVLASVALILVGVLARRGAFADAPSRVGAALLVSGVLGTSPIASSTAMSWIFSMSSSRGMATGRPSMSPTPPSAEPPLFS
jgi:signal peptidase II